MSSVANGFSCFTNAPVVVCVKRGPVKLKDGECNVTTGDVENPRLLDT